MLDYFARVVFSLSKSAISAFSVILALIIFSSSLIKAVILLDFELRRQYIADELCVNRDIPITTCGGVCYLQKQFAELEKNGNDQKLVALERSLILFNQVPLEYLMNNLLVDQETNNINIFKQDFNSDYLGDIFHPPRFSMRTQE